MGTGGKGVDDVELFDLRGRLALVTGSSQGVGLALAAALARRAPPSCSTAATRPSSREPPKACGMRG